MRQQLIEWVDQLGLGKSELIQMVISLGLIVLFSILIHLFFHRVIFGSIKKSQSKRGLLLQQLLIDTNLFSRLALTLQGIIISIQATLWLSHGSKVYEIILLLCQLFILLYALLAFYSLLNALLVLSQRSTIGNVLPLRGVFQSIKLAASILVIIMMVSLLVGKSPLILLSGLGAMTAIIMLVFKDAILGLVAGIQLSANRMLHVGDWLEMPKYRADGDVIDIGLTTVKVQNWDKTITTIPTYALISDSFINWRGMTQSGGRRIKRCFYLDATSVHFLSEQELESLNKVQLIAPYLSKKTAEIMRFNQENNIDTRSLINGRHLTNIGTLRAYLLAYLKNHPKIHQEMTLMVRQLAPSEQGLPMEIYVFTNTTAWVDYEGIQSDIFDHLFAILPQFNLRLYQAPTGNDVQMMANILKTSN